MSSWTHRCKRRHDHLAQVRKIMVLELWAQSQIISEKLETLRRSILHNWPAVHKGPLQCIRGPLHRRVACREPTPSCRIRLLALYRIRHQSGAVTAQPLAHPLLPS